MYILACLNIRRNVGIGLYFHPVVRISSGVAYSGVRTRGTTFPHFFPRGGGTQRGDLRVVVIPRRVVLANPSSRIVSPVRLTIPSLARWWRL